MAITATDPSRSTRETSARTVTPRVDIYETETSVVLLADMPGVGANDLDVVAERDTLTVRGRVPRAGSAPEYQEFELADYMRAFTVTEDLDLGNVTATLRDGVLRVEIPRSAKVQPKKIPVRAG